MKSEKSLDKKESEQKEKYVRPVLSGSITLRAKKGKVLPLRYVGADLVRVTEKKEGLALDWGSLPYDSRNMIHRALKAKDVELISKK